MVKLPRKIRLEHRRSKLCDQVKQPELVARYARVVYYSRGVAPLKGWELASALPQIPGPSDKGDLTLVYAPTLEEAILNHTREQDLLEEATLKQEWALAFSRGTLWTEPKEPKAADSQHRLDRQSSSWVRELGQSEWLEAKTATKIYIALMSRVKKESLVESDFGCEQGDLADHYRETSYYPRGEAALKGFEATVEEPWISSDERNLKLIYAPTLEEAVLSYEEFLARDQASGVRPSYQTTLWFRPVGQRQWLEFKLAAKVVIKSITRCHPESGVAARADIVTSGQVCRG